MSYKRVRRVTKEMWESAKRLINMNDTSGGGYTRAQLGAMLDPKLSDSTMSLIACSNSYEDYLDRVNTKLSKRIKESGVAETEELKGQISINDVMPNETPLVKLIVAIDYLVASLTEIRQALDEMADENEQVDHAG